MNEWLEVTVTWGTQVLAIRHLELGQGFTIGDTPIVVGRGGAWLVATPGKSEPTAVHPGLRVSMDVEGVTIDVAAVPPAEKVRAGVLASITGGGVAAIAVSLLGHVTVVATMAAFEPPPKRSILDGPPREQLLAMKALLDASDAREKEEETPGPEPSYGDVSISEKAWRARVWELRHRYALEPEPPPIERVYVPPPPTRLHQRKVTSNGRLPVEVIQRIIRQNFGRFRLCYDQGLRDNPKLEGSVTVKLVIGRDGAVTQADDGGSELPDHAVVSCIVRSFYSISFPQPESGIVTATYSVALGLRE